MRGGMTRLLLRWIVLTLAIVLAGYPTRLLGFDYRVDTSSTSAVIGLFVGAAVLALLNATLGRLLKFLTLPLNCLTLGLFSLVINAGMLLAADQMTPSLHVGGFIAGFVGSLFISAVNGLLGSMLLPDKDD